MSCTLTLINIKTNKAMPVIKFSIDITYVLLENCCIMHSVVLILFSVTSDNLINPNEGFSRDYVGLGYKCITKMVCTFFFF